MLARIEQAAQSMGLGNIGRVEAPTVEALRALRPAVFSGASAVLVVGSGMFWNYRRYIVALVNEARLPAIYPERESGDLPIQEPVRFDFVVNLKTARELSLTIPGDPRPRRRGDRMTRIA